MSCVGTFVGGYLCLPQLGIKIRYTPDMIVFLATREVEHFISNFTGVRFGMVHCCHWSRVKNRIGEAQWYNEQGEIIQNKNKK